MRPWKVLYVQRPTGGGSMLSLLEALRRVDRDRVDPVVLLPHGARHADRFREVNVEVRTTQLLDPSRTPESAGRVRSMMQMAAAARRFARLIREGEFDLVHHNNNPAANRASIAGCRLARRPQVCHVRFFARYRRIDRRLAPSVQRFVYISRVIEEHCREALGIPESQGLVLDNMFDFGAAGGRDRAALRQELGIGPDAPVVTNVGRLVPWKGQDVFLRAVAQVVPRFPGLRCLVVGGHGDTPDEAAFVGRLSQLADDLGIADRVRFTGHRDDASDIMAASDVVVHSAIRPEPFGRVVVEAMAVGAAVIATAAGGVTEVIEHDRTGILVPPGEVSDMTSALDRLLSSPDRRQALGRQGAIDARDRFGTDKTIRAIEALYAELMNPSTAA